MTQRKSVWELPARPSPAELEGLVGKPSPLIPHRPHSISSVSSLLWQWSFKSEPFLAHFVFIKVAFIFIGFGACRISYYSHHYDSVLLNSGWRKAQLVMKTNEQNTIEKTQWKGNSKKHPPLRLLRIRSDIWITKTHSICTSQKHREFSLPGCADWRPLPGCCRGSGADGHPDDEGQPGLTRPPGPTLSQNMFPVGTQQSQWTQTGYTWNLWKANKNIRWGPLSRANVHSSTLDISDTTAIGIKPWQLLRTREIGNIRLHPCLHLPTCLTSSSAVYLQRLPELGCNTSVRQQGFPFKTLKFLILRNCVHKIFFLVYPSLS